MRLKLSQQELDKQSGNEGLEIVIEGCTGDPLETSPGTSIYIEKYEGKVQVHIWDGTQADCQTIILKETK
jgi:hypothetical protein